MANSSGFWLNPLYYRTRLCLDILRIFVFPSLVLRYLLAHFNLSPLPVYLSIPAHILAIVAWGALRNVHSDWQQAREARKLGAKMIPRIRGKWPGNIDVLLRMMKAFRQSYIMDVYLELFQEYQCTTLNTRILWVDQIISMDEEHMKYVLSTGFNHFWRGRRQKERMERFLGDGIFNRDGEKWRMHRATARPFFARERISDFQTFNTHTTRTLELIEKLSAEPWTPAPSVAASPSKSALPTVASYPASSHRNGGKQDLPTPIDAQDVYARFTLDSASSFLFGRCLDTLAGNVPRAGRAAMGPKGSMPIEEEDGEKENPRAPGAGLIARCLSSKPSSSSSSDASSPSSSTPTFTQFTTAFEHAQCMITRRARLGYFWPLAELFKDTLAEDARIARRWVQDVVRDVGGRKRSKKAGKGEWGAIEKGEMEGKTFLEHLIQSSDDEDLIRDELLSILLASRDTTSCTLTFVTYFMALHPDVAKKMRAEVLETHGLTAVPTYESVRGLKYMRAVINEALRLFPPVPLNMRESRTNGVALPPPPSHLYKPASKSSSYHVPPPSTPLYMPGGTPIMYMPLLMHRNPDLWGADADEFDPERWLDSKRLARMTANPLMFTPFSAGPRICLGQNFAYNEASFFLVRLLQQYDTFTLAPEAQPAGSLPPEHWKLRSGRQKVERCFPAAALTLYATGGLWVRFGRAKDAPPLSETGRL